MGKLVKLAAILCCFQFGSFGAPSAPSQPLISILRVELRAHDLVNETLSGVRDALGYKSDAEVIRKAVNDTDDLLDKLKLVLKTVSKQVSKYEEPTLKELADRIVETADSLRSSDPATASKARDYLAGVQSGSCLSLVGEAADIGSKLDKQKDDVTNEIVGNLSQLFLAASETVQKTSDALEPAKDSEETSTE